jgi:ribosomal protein L11 methyltransferase
MSKRSRGSNSIENMGAEGAFPDSRPQTSDPGLPLQRWLCLSVQVPHEATEAVADFLIALGSHGVVEGVQDFTFAPQPTSEVQGFFPADTNRSVLCDTLRQYLEDLSVVLPNGERPTPSLTEMSPEAWTESWREHFPPLTAGNRFLLLPPWEPIPASSDRQVIVINPSMAFGTGHHATTQGCLEAIEILCTLHGAPSRALDLGTGSGVLAIALVKLGAQAVWATDIDPIALDEAQKNLDANQADQRVFLSHSPVEDLPGPFSLIVANLFSHTLITLAPVLQTAIEPRGYVILSGIQIDQEAAVRTVYRTPAWHLLTRLVRDEWVTLVVQRT